MKRPDMENFRYYARKDWDNAAVTVCDYVNYLEAENKKLRAQLDDEKAEYHKAIGMYIAENRRLNSVIHDMKDCTPPFPENLPQSTAENPY